jgi:kynurenine formamidase
MILIDLSRDIEHKMAVLPNHPQVVVTSFGTHDEVRTADGYAFSSATRVLMMGDHAGTHVDWRTISPRRSVSTCRTSH